MVYSLSLSVIHTHHRSDRTICDNAPPESLHQLADMLLIFGIFTVMLTVLVLPYSQSVAPDSCQCLRTTLSNAHTHTHTHTHVCMLKHFNKALTSMSLALSDMATALLQQASKWTPVVSQKPSHPPWPLLPPVDAYSPLQLCCSISHPTHAVMGCRLYLATVPVTPVQMGRFYSLTLSVGVKQRWVIGTQLLLTCVFDKVAFVSCFFFLSVHFLGFCFLPCLFVQG